jgi:FtsZ-binding cell division protein ZapB
MSTRKSATTADDILASLTDAKVLDGLGKALAPIIAQAIEANLTRRIEELTVKVNSLEGTVKTLTDSNVLLVNKQNGFEREVADLQKRLRETEGRVEDTETYSRAHDLIIRGLPEDSYAQRAQSGSTTGSATATAESSVVLEDAIIQLCHQSMGVDIDRRDISVAHRLRASNKDKFRPVIIRFTSRRVRDTIFRAKRELKSLPKESPIFIAEHLTKTASTLFFEARKLVRDNKLSAAWTMNGLVNVKKTDTAAERPTVVRNLQELEAAQLPVVRVVRNH